MENIMVKIVICALTFAGLIMVCLIHYLCCEVAKSAIVDDLKLKWNKFLGIIFLIPGIPLLFLFIYYICSFLVYTATEGIAKIKKFINERS